VSNFVYKLHLIKVGLLNMALSTDKKWKKPAGDSSRISRKRTKHVIFVRHGESAWNVVFNKGFGPSFPGRLGRALRTEAQLSTTLDSVFVDSPLSPLGAQQALDLQKFIESMPESDPVAPILKGTAGAGASILCSSNLRRAISTSCIAFCQRLRRTQEKIHIISCLQEITFNIDGIALAKPRTSPVLSDVELSAMGHTRKDFNSERFFVANENEGDKKLRSKGLTRLLAFAKWAMDRPEQTVIAAGHSLYFRFFFQTFLPLSSTHIAKKDKMGNGCIVSFSLFEGNDPNGQIFYGVDESSIRVIYHDFESNLKHAEKKTN